jgi:serine/threonine-protein kinase
MSLAAGSRVGAYEIVAKIGQGGMGEVWRATDTRLKRQVALKVLPGAFVSDPERIARFQREAEVLAALNHSNIAQIYGIEEAGGVTALVLELVEGSTLADRIAKGSIPVEEALPIAKQIAEALEVAHEQGIIHRDLKPANIKVRDDGTVKVLDFGLAKLAEPAVATAAQPVSPLTQSPTLTSPAMMTGVGMLLGTAAYMAPEQAKGRPADKRSDVWAFGCVLYEMLTAKRAFAGEDIGDTLAAILRGQPDWEALPADVPPILSAALHKCLDRDRARRIANVAAMSFAMEYASRAATRVARPNTRLAVLIGAIGVALALFAIVAALSRLGRATSSTKTPSVARFRELLPQGQAWPNSGARLVAVSPDGENIVYVNNQQLFIRKLMDAEARPIQGTAQAAETPFFSPDGQWVAFYASAERKIKRIALAGGTAVTICDAEALYGATWSATGDIFFGQFGGTGRRGIFRVSAEGGKAQLAVAPGSNAAGGDTSPGLITASPQLLPSGDLLFTISQSRSATGWDRAQIVVQSLASGTRRVVLEGGSDARYVASGHLLYALGTTIMAVPFDVKQLKVVGGAVPVVEGVQRTPAGTTGAAQYSVADAGTLVYIPGPQANDPLALKRVDRNGAQVPLPIPQGTYASPRISPDGQQLVFHDENASEHAIWIYDLGGRRPLRRLTFDGANDRPLWSRDGQRVMYRSYREDGSGLFWQRADGVGSAERLVRGEPGTGVQPEALSPDAKTLVLSVSRGGDRHLATLQLDGDQSIRPLLPEYTTNSSLSADGNWLAYYSNDSGRDAVYVQSFPPSGTKYLISQADSRDPLWSPDGRELFYLQRIGTTSWRLVSLPVQTKGGFTFDKATELPIDGLLGTGPRAYDVMPDGKSFIAIFASSDSEKARDTLNITLNWLQELKIRVPVRN